MNRGLCSLNWLRAFLLLAALCSTSATQAMPSFDAVRQAWRPSDMALLDRNGEMLQRLRVDQKIRRLDWIALRDISPALVAAVVQAEDKRFYRHAGVDWTALARAALDTLLYGKRRGASTLTMQLAGLLDPALQPKNGRRSYRQKWDQIVSARELEQGWSKQQILEAYFNLVSYRGEYQGIAAAAQGLFGKIPDGLDAAEALILASLLRAPNAAPMRVAQRACQLARRAAAKIPCAQIETRVASALARSAFSAAETALAPQVAHQLLAHATTAQRSTLDLATQRVALEALFEQLRQLKGSRVQEGAVLAVDNRSGEVLAYVSGGPDSAGYYVDGVIARRQAGSTLKPFLYSLALEQRLLTAASLIDDAPVNLPTAHGVYAPQNYDHEFKGLVSVRLALSGSLNVPAVKTLSLVGADAFLERLRALGFTGLDEEGDYYGYALALGSPEVSLWQLVNAYRTLANGGRYGPLTLMPGGKPAAAQVIDPAAAFVVADILADRGARAITFGLDSPLATRYWSAVKTGTSKDMRDNWCIGFSARYTVGVWVGNYDGAPMHDVSGISGAAPVWLEVMNSLQRDAPEQSPTAPRGVVTRQVRFEPPLETPRREWFLAGTETALVSLAPGGSVPPRITYPADGEILALDPDIPVANQAVFFEMEPLDRSMSWRLDGTTLTPDSPWQPQHGRHLLTLHDRAGHEVDRVHFVTRGSRAMK